MQDVQIKMQGENAMFMTQTEHSSFWQLEQQTWASCVKNINVNTNATQSHFWILYKYILLFYFIFRQQI